MYDLQSQIWKLQLLIFENIFVMKLDYGVGI